jgi:hypothetical protein
VLELVEWSGLPIENMERETPSCQASLLKIPLNALLAGLCLNPALAPKGHQCWPGKKYLVQSFCQKLIAGFLQDHETGLDSNEVLDGTEQPMLQLLAA